MRHKRGRVGRTNNQPNVRQALTKVWNQASQPLPAQLHNASRDNQVYQVKQIVEFGQVSTSSAGAETDFAQSFLLAQCPGVSSWTAVFDQYRIVEIEAWIRPSTNTTGNAAGFDGFRLYTVVDYDDDSTTSIASLQQFQNVTDTSRFEGVYRAWKPHTQGPLLNASNAQVGAQNVLAPWIDAGQPSIKHFGLKYAMTATSTTVVVGITARFTIHFRNVF